MAETSAKSFFPVLFAKLDKKKQAARNAPLSNSDINTLLSIHFQGEPLYPAIDTFYSEEYKNAMEKGVIGEELDTIKKFRIPTEEELNLLYCDVHARDEKLNYSGTNQAGG